VIYGDGGQSCGYCHGRPPPTAKATATRNRIVAVGAAAPDAAALRRAMAQPALGGLMERLLADPALTDAQLDAIRLWLRALRDGRPEVQPDRIVIHNPRSKDDPPVRFAVLRAEGWRLPADGECRIDRPLPGGTSCELPRPPGRERWLVYRFAASPALAPAEVRVKVAASAP
jgi:hypothetical protein